MEEGIYQARPRDRVGSRRNQQRHAKREAQAERTPEATASEPVVVTRRAWGEMTSSESEECILGQAIATTPGEPQEQSESKSKGRLRMKNFERKFERQAPTGGRWVRR